LTVLKAVLFDVDDTLLDWSAFRDDWMNLESEHLQHVVDFLHTEFDVFTHGVEAYTAEFRNRTIAAWTAARGTMVAPNVARVLHESAVALGCPADQLDAARLLSHYHWRMIPGTSLFPEVHDVMKTLINAGIKVGLVTNAYQPMSLRDIELAGFGILEYFPDCRVSAADVGYLKPHPAIFELALNKIGSTPESTVFVGDDPEADIIGAQRMRMKAVLRYTTRREHDYSVSKADGTITTLTELLPHLDAWYPGWR